MKERNIANKNTCIAVMSIFIVMIVFSAWLSDDAYHGFVMGRHLLQGEGFVYNVGERVSATTCPLCTLVITFVAGILCGFMDITNAFYFSGIINGIVFTVMAIYILIRYYCKNGAQMVECLIILGGARSFMMFTTSGLENPMLFFEAIVFLSLVFMNYDGSYSELELFLLAFVFSMIALTRMDNALIYTPVIIFCFLFRRDGISIVRAALIGGCGLLPFFIWEGFSVFYYGTPFPNTAYAKINTGISSIQYIIKGFEYIGTVLMTDLITVLITITVPALWIIFGKSIKYTLISIGVYLYLVYIIKIGGDFMLGRHLTVPLFISVALLILLQNNNDISHEIVKIKELAMIVPICIVILSLNGTNNFFNQFLWKGIYANKAKVADERAFYYPYTSLINNLLSIKETGNLSVPKRWNTKEIDAIREHGNNRGLVKWAPGILVFYNTDIYLNDKYCLGDPLLSRIQIKPVDGMNFRIGHTPRDIPDGYRESIINDDNEIKNPELRKYYDVIKSITRGELFEKKRLKYIIEFNMGKYDYLIDSYNTNLKSG